MTEISIVKFDLKHSPIITGIRHAVFTIEQNIDESKDQDGEDPGAVHALVKLDNKYVATGRMLADGHVGRLAVLKPFRRKKLGSKILLSFVEEAIKQQLNSVYLGAQLHAIDFYQKSGFSKYGEHYFEVGIEHVYMRRIIDKV